jgi:hypothetical protein
MATKEYRDYKRAEPDCALPEHEHFHRSGRARPAALATGVCLQVLTLIIALEVMFPILYIITLSFSSSAPGLPACS